MAGNSIFELGDNFGGVASPFGDWLGEQAEARKLEEERRLKLQQQAMAASPKSMYRVILMGGVDYYNEGAYGSNKTLGTYVEVIALSDKYKIPLQKGDIQIVNSPLFGSSSPDGKDIYDDLLAIIKNNFDTVNGTLILYGYSWGGHLLLAFQDFFTASKINTSLLLTIDAAKGPVSGTVNRKVNDNVKHNLNIYQTSRSSIGSRGDSNTGKNVKNVDLTGEKNLKDEEIVHSNIDEYTLLYCAQVIVYALSGIYSYEKSSSTEIKQHIKTYASQGF